MSRPSPVNRNLPRRWHGLRRVVWTAAPAAGVAAAVAGWWAVTERFGWWPYVLATPSEVAAVFWRLPDHLLAHTWVTLRETLAGFAVATGLGMVLASVLAATPLVSRAVMPTLVALHAIPKLALAPLLVVTLGFGMAPKIVMVVLVCVFPIILATATGLRSTPAELVEMSRSLCAAGWRVYLKVRLPAALPHVFVGLKTAAPLAVIGAVVGELFGATAGLGYLIRVATSDTPLVFASLLLLAGMSIGVYYLVVAAEQLFAPWVRHTTS